MPVRHDVRSVEVGLLQVEERQVAFDRGAQPPTQLGVVLDRFLTNTSRFLRAEEEELAEPDALWRRLRAPLGVPFLPLGNSCATAASTGLAKLAIGEK